MVGASEGAVVRRAVVGASASAVAAGLRVVVARQTWQAAALWLASGVEPAALSGPELELAPVWALQVQGLDVRVRHRRRQRWTWTRDSACRWMKW